MINPLLEGAMGGPFDMRVTIIQPIATKTETFRIPAHPFVCWLARKLPRWLAPVPYLEVTRVVPDHDVTYVDGRAGRVFMTQVAYDQLKRQIKARQASPLARQTMIV